MAHVRYSRSASLAGLYALLILTCAPPVRALDPNRSVTQYLQRIWQVPQGLPDATIHSILQTSDGYLWLATQRGLIRFDGVRFSAISSSSGISLDDRWITSLLEDPGHGLWIGTNDAGLIHLENGVAAHYGEKEGLPAENVRCLTYARNGDLWICTVNGLARWSQGKLTAYGTAQGLPSARVRAACQAPDGTMWFGGDDARLAAWDGSRFSVHPLTSIPKYANVFSLVCSGDGAIWVGATNGLVELRNGRERLFTVQDGLADNRVLALVKSRDGSLWIGSRNGFSRLRNGEFDSFRGEDGLSQSTVYSLREDREGSLWVGTKNGLNQFLDRRTIPYTTREGLPSNDTGPVLQDRRGAIWVGTLDAGLARYDGRRVSVLTTQQGLVSNSIRALAEDSSGHLWVGTDSGLNRLRDGVVDATFTTRQGLPSNSIRSLFAASPGVLWIGTAAGLTTFENGRLVSPRGFTGATQGPILALGEDPARSILAAFDGGALDAYANGHVRPVAQDGALARDIDAFYLDPGGLLWMGTLGSGLRLIENGKVHSFFIRDGLFDNEIYGIVGDGEDRLWMACSKGIFSVSRSDLRSFAAGKISKLVSTQYSPLDGLRTLECKAGVQPAAWKMRDGRIWFSTSRGVLVVDPSLPQRSFIPPPVVIEDVTVNGETTSPDKIAKLPPGQTNLEFRYTGLSFVAPARIVFRYLLEGFDKKWIDAGARREAFYTNLPPGNFRFRVTACNLGGACNETGGYIAFNIAPRFYQRVWFLPACALALAFGVWLAYRLRIRHLKERFATILGERSRIARELHDTLIQGFSGVTMEMQALSARLVRSEHRGALEEIIHDAGNCLREARRSVAGLRGARGTDSGLSVAIAMAARQITETKDIRLHLKLAKSPENIGADAEYNLLRIAQEALNNSVAHSGARNIEVSLRCAADSVRLSVKDDGSGFGPEQNGFVQLGHYGLLGMKERASHIGAEFGLESSPGRGTTVSVALPRRKNGNGAAESHELEPHKLESN